MRRLHDYHQLRQEEEQGWNRSLQEVGVDPELLAGLLKDPGQAQLSQLCEFYLTSSETTRSFLRSG